MFFRPAVGEVLLAAAFGGIGVFWMVTAAGMPLWDGFSPGSGFLPLIYGGLLAVLAAGVLAAAVFGRSGEALVAEESLRKPILVAGALLFAAVAVEPLGFVPAIFIMLLFLYGAVERLPIVITVVVAAVTVAVLYVVFRTWLGVPLPAGLWAF